MPQRNPLLLSVLLTRDGLWSVNQREPARIAIAYFPTKWSALRHAVRVAKSKRRCKVAVLERNGDVKFSHEYVNSDLEVELP